ncbi:MAG: hypothetical protein SF029_22510 [bacterium]|nr:hypothetical protein [bacterium]
MDTLQQIQQLQFEDRSAAEGLLLSFLRETLALDVVHVELRPLAVSLNSFNGFLTLGDGRRYFFKTHTEQDNVITEYYNAAMLAEAGYPVIQPVMQSSEAGKQLLVYEVIDSPSVFDLAWEIENERSDAFIPLQLAQEMEDQQLFQRYRTTFAWQEAEDAGKAPIHQLFYHRLTGGRLDRFYGDGTRIRLPQGDFLMSEVRQVRWTINGHVYHQTIDDLIAVAIHLLEPHQSVPSIIGHGDAHNGNVFYQSQHRPPSLLYFDPAFAGRHHPLLDLTKPLFHNVFAMWMYFPQEKDAQTQIQVRTDGDHWQVDYDYLLHPVRHMFLNSKTVYVLKPLLEALRQRGWLREDWRTYLKAALFCCPFLTMNLADSQKFPPEISLLGLCMAVEMGAESEGKRSLIDQTLDTLR